ncbi:hypothetical protein HIMB100_00018620 [SAR116 cluster alpha proteobacterium HIMB100]|nr:hypothetical protein HIMB100_00018620 [SAR116 cluster alpha proteobacterium HIMB100]
MQVSTLTRDILLEPSRSDITKSSEISAAQDK